MVYCTGAPDKVWRDKNNQNFDNGFRAKIRILGYHPSEDEEEGGISDEDLPWAHFLVSPQFGAGNNYTGTSFALQGGEMVIGFFLDGEEGQQPVILGSFYANYKIEDFVSYKEALDKGTTGFKAFEFDPNIDMETTYHLKRRKVLTAGGVVDSNEKIRDENNVEKKTIENTLTISHITYHFQKYAQIQRKNLVVLQKDCRNLLIKYKN